MRLTIRKMASAALAGALASSLAFPAAALASNYSDVPDDHWAEASGVIDYATDRGLFGGYGNGCWGPDDPLLRCQVAVVMYRLTQPNIKGSIDYLGDWIYYMPQWMGSEDSNFPYKYYTRALAWASVAGLVKGDGSATSEREVPDVPGTGGGAGLARAVHDITVTGTLGDGTPYTEVRRGVTVVEDEAALRPEDPITREEFCVMLKRFAEYLDYLDEYFEGDSLVARSDTHGGKIELADLADAGSVSAWARDAVSWAVGEGIITGKSDKWIDPQGTTTRAEAAKMWTIFLKGAAFDTSAEHSRVYVENREYTFDTDYSCTNCGAFAPTKDGIVHNTWCSSLTGATWWVSMNFGDPYWHQPIPYPEKMRERGFLVGWYDWV